MDCPDCGEETVDRAQFMLAVTETLDAVTMDGCDYIYFMVQREPPHLINLASCCPPNEVVGTLVGFLRRQPPDVIKFIIGRLGEPAEEIRPSWSLHRLKERGGKKE